VRRDLAIIALLTMAVGAVYWPVSSFEFLNFDDGGYVRDNWNVRPGLTAKGILWAFTTVHIGNWHPLTWLSHMADCQLFGLWAGGHHLVNVALHAANSVLVYLVLARMTSRPWPSAFVAALFALHPLHVESVAWIAERKDVLSTFFGLLALLAYAWHAERPSRLRYAAVFALLALGLMAKPMLVTLPLVMLLLDYWPLGRLTAVPGSRFGAPGSRFSFPVSRFPIPASRLLSLVLEKLPLLVLAAASSVLTYAAQAEGGAVVPRESCPLDARVANALVAYVLYLSKAFWPSGLAVFYPYKAWPLWQAAATGAFLAAVTALALLAARRRTAPLPDGRGSDTAPYLPVGWFWYLGTLMPVIGLVQVGEQAMADRYTYLPLVGVFVAVTWLAADLTAGWRHRMKILVPLAAAAIAACMMLTWRQVGYWADSETLFRRAADAVPGNYLAYGNLGSALAERGQLEEALLHFQEALRSKPDHSTSRQNVGAILYKQGRFEEAAEHLRAAVRLAPHSGCARANLGAALYRLGRLDEAAYELREALRTDPDNADAHGNLAAVLIVQGRLDGAIAHCREAIRLDPELAAPHNNWGLALMHAGRAEDALPRLYEAVRLDPAYADAHDNLGVCLFRVGRREEAVQHLREAARLAPHVARTRLNLGVALYHMDRNQEAIPELREAVRLDPGQADAYVNLAAAYAGAGRFAEAAQAAKEASALATARGRADLAARIDAQRQLYEAGRPAPRGP